MPGTITNIRATNPRTNAIAVEKTAEGKYRATGELTLTEDHSGAASAAAAAAAAKSERPCTEMIFGSALGLEEVKGALNTPGQSLTIDAETGDY